MSILIKGMEMPTSFEECQTVLGCCDAFEDGTVWCRLAHGYIGDERTVCPIVPVPPHGRLIDADALKLSHCKECTLYPDKCLEKTDEGCDWESIYHIEHCAPTIIPAEEGET